MLNYIWFLLIVLGIAVAVWHDASDATHNVYRNGEEIHFAVEIDELNGLALSLRREYSCFVLIHTNFLARFYGLKDSLDTLERLPASLTLAERNSGRLKINLEKSTFEKWKEMAALQGNQRMLQGIVRIEQIENGTALAAFRTDPIRFVTINKVTNDGILRYAKVAVELAIGLIGIMALWLGVMRIAEQSGLIGKLARVLEPVMTRLFPDVPADHPAMGAMIMNLSANMLGLANAATPLGLKAMEELNKLNKKLGTATDAMCTFLVINTSNVQLIPATVIAIRAAAGSANPTEILGPAIVATTISTVVGVLVVKALGRMKFYKKQLEKAG